LVAAYLLDHHEHVFLMLKPLLLSYLSNLLT